MLKKKIDLTQYVVIGCGLIPITDTYFDTVYEQDEKEDGNNKDEPLSGKFLNTFN